MTTQVSPQIIDTAGNISFTAANVSLGAVANVKITGGANTQVISTDGTGNLTFTNVNARMTGYNLVFGG
jgi:carbamoylphosphate synthase large subunit